MEGPSTVPENSGRFSPEGEVMWRFSHMSRREVTSLSAFVQNSGNSGRECWLLWAIWTAAAIGGECVGGGHWGIRLNS